MFKAVVLYYIEKQMLILGRLQVIRLLLFEDNNFLIVHDTNIFR